MPPAPPHPGEATGYAVLPSPSVVHEAEVRRSRFIAHLARVQSEDQARELFAAVRGAHPAARHVCTAFVLGPAQSVQRSNDDGEPSGTAGMPMLEALARRGDLPDGASGLSDIAAAVVRYFGGVKLGAGGLVRAYSDAVSSALDTVTLLHRAPRALWRFSAPPAQAGLWENELRAAGQTMEDVEYGPTAVQMTVAVPDTRDDADHLRAHLAALSGGTAVPELAGRRWVDVPQDIRTGGS